MTQLRWTLPAQGDLRRIDEWLTLEAEPLFAIRTLTAIRFRAGFLLNFPRGGRPYRDGTRILRVLDTPYLLHYRIAGTGLVEILRVYHERADWLTAP